MPEVRFAKNEQGEVVLIRGEERTVLGALETVGEEMCRFLAQEDYGERGEAIASEIDRARRAGAHYERQQGREAAARAIESGASDDSAIVRTMALLLEGRV